MSVRCILAEEIVRGRERRKRNKPRKAVNITFVVPPCKDCENLAECAKGVRIVKRMIRIMELYHLDEYEEVSMYDPKLSKTLKARGIPELWMHDFEDTTMPVWPHKMYYIVEFDDGTKRLFTWIQDSDDEDYGGGSKSTELEDVTMMYA